MIERLDDLDGLTRHEQETFDLFSKSPSTFQESSHEKFIKSQASKKPNSERKTPKISSNQNNQRKSRSNSSPTSPSFDKSPKIPSYKEIRSQEETFNEILSRDLVGAVIQMQVRNLGYPIYLSNWNLERSFLMKMTVVLSANVLILSQYLLTIHHN